MEDPPWEEHFVPLLVSAFSTQKLNNAKAPSLPRFCSFGFYNFEFVSDFDIRISDFTFQSAFGFHISVVVFSI
jgi:hypothetical protein